MDEQKLWITLGKLEQSNKDQKEHLVAHCFREDEDRRIIKKGIENINIKLAAGIECPHKEEISDNVKDVSKMKGERKYLYGGLVLVFAAIAKKLFHN